MHFESGFPYSVFWSIRSWINHFQRGGGEKKRFQCCTDYVSVLLRLQSLSTQVPPWDFREEVGHPMEVSQEVAVLL